MYGRVSSNKDALQTLAISWEIQRIYGSLEDDVGFSKNTHRYMTTLSP